MLVQDVPITGPVLTWAREDAAVAVEALARRLGVGPDRVAQREARTARPTPGPFSRLVRVWRRPSAVFFLPAPPAQTD